MNLIDCYIELFYYTIFLKSMDFGALVFDGVRKHYKDLFLRAANAAKKKGYSKTDWDDGLFPVCAWIDEVIFCSDWPDKTKWVQSPLQLNFFNMTNAGDEFFTRLQNLDKNNIEVRKIYDYCLALGFKGKYYNADDIEKLNEIMNSNLSLITENVRMEYPEICFPEAYSKLSEPHKRKQRMGGNPLFTFLGIIIPVALFTTLYLVFSNNLSEKFIQLLQLLQ